MPRRGEGLRIWAAVLAVYGLLLHAPSMAALGHPSAVATAEHRHAAPEAEPGRGTGPLHGAGICCVLCGGGSCSVGPVGSAVLALPTPFRLTRRIRRARSRAPVTRRSSWFEARGPPSAA